VAEVSQSRFPLPDFPRQLSRWFQCFQTCVFLPVRVVAPDPISGRGKLGEPCCHICFKMRRTLARLSSKRLCACLSPSAARLRSAPIFLDAVYADAGTSLAFGSHDGAAEQLQFPWAAKVAVLRI